jgi:hypothetical protein
MTYDSDDYLRLRRLTGEVDKNDYSDADLELALVDAAGDFSLAAASIWRLKAGSYAELVDISEAGSSRKNGSLYDRAIAQAAYFEGQAGVSPTATETASTTRRIVRE